MKTVTKEALAEAMTELDRHHAAYRHWQQRADEAQATILNEARSPEGAAAAMSRARMMARQRRKAEAWRLLCETADRAAELELALEDAQVRPESITDNPVQPDESDDK